MANNMTTTEANLILAFMPVNTECDYCDEPAVRKIVVEPFEARQDDNNRDVVDVCERHKYVGNLHNAPSWGIAG